MRGDQTRESDLSSSHFSESLGATFWLFWPKKHSPKTFIFHCRVFSGQLHLEGYHACEILMSKTMERPGVTFSKIEWLLVDEYNLKIQDHEVVFHLDAEKQVWAAQSTENREWGFSLSKPRLELLLWWPIWGKQGRSSYMCSCHLFCSDLQGSQWQRASVRHSTIEQKELDEACTQKVMVGLDLPATWLTEYWRICTWAGNPPIWDSSNGVQKATCLHFWIKTSHPPWLPASGLSCAKVTLPLFSLCLDF